MSDVLSPAQRSYCMSQIKGKHTKPEITLRKALWRLGARYRVKYKLKGNPDIVFPSQKVVVFVDGCFWHCCPIHFKPPDTNKDFWLAKLKRNVERDKKVVSELTELNWKVIRIWEHQIKDDLPACVEKILEAVHGPNSRQ